MTRNDDQQRGRQSANAARDDENRRDEAISSDRNRGRDNIAEPKPYKESPDDLSGRSTTEQSGTARRAERATGRPAEPSTRGDAGRAFEQSRGDRTSRPEPDQR